MDGAGTFAEKIFMSKKAAKIKKSTTVEYDLERIIVRKKSENQALHKLLQFIEKGTKGKKQNDH